MLDKLFYIVAKERVSSPCSIILFVTNKCNARCLHCFNWVNIDREEKEELTLDDLKNISASLGRLMDMSISGGEPFLRKDLADILEIFYRNNHTHSFSIPTNGLLPEVIFQEVKRILERIRKARLSVNISLDGLKEEHDYLRQRKGAFSQVVKTYERLRDLKKKYNLGMKILTTISNRNISHLEELMDWVADYMPDIDFHNFEILRGNPRDINISAPSATQLEEIKEKIFRHWKRFHFYGHSFSSIPAYWFKRYLFEIYIKTLKEERQIIPCFAGTLTLVIDASGNVYFCELLPKVGNIKEKTLWDILFSSEAERQRRHIKSRGCYCVHSCFQGKNLYLNYKLYGRLFGYIINKKLNLKLPA